MCCNLNFPYSILTSILYRVRTLTSRNAEESENSPESPHPGEIKRMRKQCVPGARMMKHLLPTRVTDLYLASSTIFANWAARGCLLLKFCQSTRP